MYGFENGNELKLTAISAEQDVFYTASLSDFTRKGVTFITAEGETEHFEFVGPNQLTSNETMMVQNYMNMTHRTNMQIIDLMDGTQDYIWKRVDEYGNERW